MSELNRRSFLQSNVAALGLPDAAPAAPRPPTIDFRYAPLSGQAAFCFPDDPHKSLVGERGDLRYRFDRSRGLDGFGVRVLFSLRGMEEDSIAGQRLEAPGIPIVHTRIDRPSAHIDLAAFATNESAEGRVDNVLMTVRPRSARELRAAPLVTVQSREALFVRAAGGLTTVHPGSESAPPLLVAGIPLHAAALPSGWQLSAAERPASAGRPLEFFFRFPQAGQDAGAVRGGLARAGELLAGARGWWRAWSPFQTPVHWSLPGDYGDFLTACARNILQARELRDGRLTFQVGPTVYRGLWVVDGHFILEAARYLGFDREARQGLETTWARQREDGGIYAGAGDAHWKDTGIAMFTLVRDAELSQDWALFRAMAPHARRGVAHLRSLREKARAEGSTNGRYGLLANGMGDGGLGGIRSEFTNTLWALAGLEALVDAADHLRLDGFDDARTFHSELREAFFAAARREMRRHPSGFDFLPMLVKDDPQWAAADPWDRPRLQVAQWALSQAIYPGLVFGRDDPVVRGHVALMQACTREEIPAETGWLPHEGVWNYNAAFAAHACLWAGERDWARSAFHGFLNHATPLYCWREEQPLRGSLVARYIGDMPHNWASAECVLYLRHLLALEDGPALRLLAGFGAPELAAGEPYRLEGSPTRFGRVSLSLEPLDRGRGWRLEFRRAGGPPPATVEVPESPAHGLRLAELSGASSTRRDGVVLIDPAAGSWAATFRA